MMDSSGPRRILPPGTTVQVTSVDEHGWLGRDFHPSAEDVGFTGVITRPERYDSAVVVYDAETGEVDHCGRVGEVLRESENVVYTVVSHEGRALELVDHEIVPIEFCEF